MMCSLLCLEEENQTQESRKIFNILMYLTYLYYLRNKTLIYEIVTDKYFLSNGQKCLTGPL